MRERDDKLTQLTRAAAAGDSDALSELVRATQGDVWRFIAHLAGVQVADDLTQETYLRALRSLPTFGHRAPVRVWLLAIARRVVATYFDQAARERGRRERLVAQPADPAGADPGEALALGELIGSLKGAPGRVRPDPGPEPVLRAGRHRVRVPGRHHQVEGRPGPGPAHPRLRS
jgi:RNA polymerase sigma-70 factor, ECF subfamily